MLSYAFQQLKQNNYENIDGENFDEISYSGDMHPPKKQICLYFMT